MRNLFRITGILLLIILIHSCEKEDNKIIKDGDGNVYTSVTIGTQIWIVENLKTTKFNDGTAIPIITNNTAWATLTIPGYCWYNNDTTNKGIYGALYNWDVVDLASNNGKNVCPIGWHVPSGTEWITLEDNLGGYTKASVKLREIGTIHWQSPNAGATNESGFTALPGGYRLYDGRFLDIGLSGHWWSTTALNETLAFDWILFYYDSDFNGTAYEKRNGYSIRCVKD